jgi:tetratricopeptide (TPR) repeat protein
MTENDNLSVGIAAAKSGDRERARGYLAQAVKENPNLEEGWLWLGRCLTDIEQRKYCYQKVLRLNPHNTAAQSELADLLPAHETESLKPALTTSPKTSTSPVKPAEKKTDWRSNPILLSILGIIFGLCACGVPTLFLINAGSLDGLIGIPQVYAPIAATVTPFALASLPPTPSFTPTPTLIANNVPTTETAMPAVSVDTSMWQIRNFMSQGQHAEAILLLDQVIQSAPELDEAYYLRATSYHNMMKQQRSQFEFQDYLDRAMADIDQAIAIRPDHGDYYMLRQFLLVDLASLQDYQVDIQHINEYALENASAALNLGATLDEYPDRIYVIDLIYTDRCEEAVQELQKMIDQTDPNDSSIGGLYHIQSQAYACLGDIKKAIQMVDKSMFNNVNMEWKYELKARYLYQAGRRDEALQLLNTSIEQKPSYDGWRYYLRALIYQEMGEREKAEEDLMIGAGNTWWHVGLFSYVVGKMALEDGNIEEGIALLQEAEATLDCLFAPLQTRIQDELRKLGAEPLEITPSVMVDATRMPTIQARPTARPLDTPITLSTPQVTYTPTPGVSLPNDVETGMIVDLATGSGNLTLLPGDYPLLRFQPANPIPIKQVKSLIVHVIPAGDETTNPDIQIYFWVPRGGGWRYIAPIWGDNPIDRSEDHVLPEGDIFLAIRNWGTKTVVLDNVTVTLVVETLDGAIKTYGQQ